jgi:two-component system OmpR family response regulator
VKPPDPRELVARIRAVLRRRNQPTGADRYRSARARAAFCGWLLDTQRRELTAPGGHRVELTSGEYDMLLAFVERPQRVLSRDQLLDLARGRAFGGLGRSVDAQISRLRAKLDGHTDADGLLKTVRGAGYMLASDVEWA